MDCKIEGRGQQAPERNVNPLDYGLEHLTPGQQKYFHLQAQKFLQKVLMDPKAPDMLKELIRQNNAVGIMFLGGLLAAYHFEEAHNDAL